MDGLRFARANADMRRMVPLMIITILIGAPFVAFVSQMATVVFHGDERATSLLVAAQGVGAVVGAFTLGWATHRFGLWRVMAGSIAVLAAALVLYGSAPALWVATIGVAGCGFGYGSSFTTFAGLSQEAASEDMRGRALAVNTFILGALYPLGALIQGWLSDRVGLPSVTVASGVVLAIGLAWRVAVIGRRRPRTSAGDRPVDRPTAIAN
jgi:predicted MFS family arabinose efflux permease